jgi:glycosyltransferase involved in cell wall biosynthesis
MKVAYFSPLPPERTGVADYSALLLPALRERLDVEVVPRGRKRPPRGTDVALYHVGNDPEAHGWILEALRGHPGVVVLHELVLHHLIAGLTLGRRDVATYLAAMEREAGLVGRLLALGVVDGCVPPLWESRPEDFPLAGLVLDSATGMIAHSRHVERGARAAGFGGPVWRVPHPAWPAPRVEPADLGRGPVIGCLGNLNPSKRIPQLLEAFALVLERRPDARLLLVGAAAERLPLDDLLADSGLPAETVLREEHVPEERFWSLMARSDVVVGLRAPTMGETSGSVIRALSLGKPLVVSDVGWFSELPADAVWKVPVDEREVSVLAAGLERLVDDPELRTAMGEAGRELVRTEHDLGRVADRYAAALEEAAGGPAVREAVTAAIATAAAEVGIEPGSPAAVEVGARLREARIGE